MTKPKRPPHSYGLKANLFVVALTIFFAATGIQALGGPEPRIAILWGVATLFNVVVLVRQYQKWRRTQEQPKPRSEEAAPFNK